MGFDYPIASTEITGYVRMELVRPAAAVLSAKAERRAVAEDEFLVLYERTARPLRAYLYRMLGDLSRGDDILQETYLRYLQARLPTEMTEEHRKNYLFRIATNLMHNLESGARENAVLGDHPSPCDLAKDVREQNDCAQYLKQLTARHRQLLWLAYVEGFTHKEIAKIIGVKASSIRPMLARARESLSEKLKEGGFTS